MAFDPGINSLELKTEYIFLLLPSSCINHTHAIGMKSGGVLMLMRIFHMLHGEQQEEALLCEAIVSRWVSAASSSLTAADCSASLISIVSDVVGDSGSRTVVWEADRLLYLETSVVIQ